MRKLQEYIISFGGLKEGLHEFSFIADNQFFEYFENPDIHGGNILATIKMIKKSTFMELDFLLSGTLNITCDRCLEEYNADICAQNKLFVRFGDDYAEIEDNVIVIPKDEKRIDISQHLYEFAVLNLPVKRVHPNDENGKPECKPEMLEILSRHSAELKKSQQETIWANLKNMIN